MSSIQATDDDTTRFLAMLEQISAEQQTICELLDELRLLMQLPSESVLRVLESLLIPMGETVVTLGAAVKAQITEVG